MRGWSSIFVGLLLFGVAWWSFAWGGFGSATVMCVAAAAFLIVRGTQGVTVGESGDPTALIEFVRDPAGAIVDTATDRLGDWLSEAKPSAAAEPEQPKFDPDAAIARYLAQRDAGPAAPSATPASPVGFGRKGI
jgi:hypothetical protein